MIIKNKMSEVYFDTEFHLPICVLKKWQDEYVNNF